MLRLLLESFIIKVGQMIHPTKKCLANTLSREAL